MFERLKQIRQAQNLNQADFAKSLGMGQSTLAMLEVGKREILDRHIKTICSVYNVNEHWLRTGEGEMFVESDKTIISELAKEYQLDALDKKLIEHYLKLDESDRKVIKNYMFSLAQSLDRNETAATVDPIEAELNCYRQELEAEQKGEILLVSEKPNGEYTG